MTNLCIECFPQSMHVLKERICVHMMYLLKKLLVDVFTFGKDFQGANFEYRQAIYLLMTQLDRDGKK